MGKNEWFIYIYQVYNNFEFLNIIVCFPYHEHGIKNCLIPAEDLNVDIVFIARYCYYSSSSENTMSLQLLVISHQFGGT